MPSPRISTVELLDLADYMQSRPEKARRAASMAINDTARFAVPAYRRTMKEQVNFPAGYVEDPKRFGQTKKASPTDLEAAITARFRPTSLARFSNGTPSIEGARRAGGVRVRVNKGGGATFLKGAFFVRLRRGQDTSDGFNVGLAIRLKPGESLRGRRKGGSGVRLDENLYLLYGPSVDQVFQDASVSESPAVADKLVREFTRQWVRSSGEK